LIDSILIISLEKDKARRDRLQLLIKNESNKELIDKVDLIKGIPSSSVNEDFLLKNNFDYYKHWTLTKAECEKVAKQYHQGSSVSDWPCRKYYREQLRTGQLACLIGHIQCWRQIVSKGHGSALILEDDSWWGGHSSSDGVKFRQPGCLSEELEYLKDLNLEEKGIDFCFLGREPHLDRLEMDWVIDPKYVVPNYSYNSHSYILTYQGAIKLLSQKPHKKLMSADEFLAASYCKHPRPDLRKLIKTKLNAISLKEGEDLIYQATSLETGHKGISETNIESSKYIDET